MPVGLTTYPRGAPRGRRGVRGPAHDPPRRGLRHRPGGRGRVRAVARLQRGRGRGDPAGDRAGGLQAGRRGRDRARPRRERARRAGHRRRRHGDPVRAREGGPDASSPASWSTCGPTGPRATRSCPSRTAWPRTTGRAGAAHRAPRLQGPAGRRRPAGHERRADPPRDRRAGRERRPDQAQPDRDADRDASTRSSWRGGPAGRRSCPTARARPRTRRSATSSSRWAPGRSRPARRRAPSGWPSTTACSGSPTSWATRRATWVAAPCPAPPVAGSSSPEPGRPPASLPHLRMSRFVDRGAITASWVGVGMAVTIGVSFLLVIPIEFLVTPFALFAGLLIGYYANARSNRAGGPWGRILANALLAGVATGITFALVPAGREAPVLRRRQRLSRRVGRWPDHVPDRRRLRLSALPRDRARARRSRPPGSPTSTPSPRSTGGSRRRAPACCSS